MEKISNCKICNKILKGKQTMFCSTFCKNRLHQSYTSQKERGLTRKIKVVQMAGGKCSRCGYAKNYAGLAFHHLNPKKKEFKLDARSLSNRTWEKVMNEYRQCILLCHNCHAEVHNPNMDLETVSLSRLL